MFAEGVIAAVPGRQHGECARFTEQGRLTKHVFILRVPAQNSHLPAEHDATISQGGGVFLR